MKKDNEEVHTIIIVSTILALMIDSGDSYVFPTLRNHKLPSQQTGFQYSGKTKTNLSLNEVTDLVSAHQTEIIGVVVTTLLSAWKDIHHKVEQKPFKEMHITEANVVADIIEKLLKDDELSQTFSNFLASLILDALIGEISNTSPNIIFARFSDLQIIFIKSILLLTNIQITKVQIDDVFDTLYPNIEANYYAKKANKQIAEKAPSKLPGKINMVQSREINPKDLLRPIKPDKSSNVKIKRTSKSRLISLKNIRKLVGRITSKAKKLLKRKNSDNSFNKSYVPFLLVDLVLEEYYEFLKSSNIDSGNYQKITLDVIKLFSYLEILISLGINRSRNFGILFNIYWQLFTIRNSLLSIYNSKVAKSNLISSNNSSILTPAEELIIERLGNISEDKIPIDEKGISFILKNFEKIQLKSKITNLVGGQLIGIKAVTKKQLIDLIIAIVGYISSALAVYHSDPRQFSKPNFPAISRNMADDSFLTQSNLNTGSSSSIRPLQIRTGNGHHLKFEQEVSSVSSTPPIFQDYSMKSQKNCQVEEKPIRKVKTKAKRSQVNSFTKLILERQKENDKEFGNAPILKSYQMTEAAQIKVSE